MESKYPRSERYRAHKEEALAHADQTFEHFRDAFERSIRQAFGPEIDVNTLTPEEKQDILNFFEYASKRISAGAVSSRAYHEAILRAEYVSEALMTLASLEDLAHDGMHAAVAYRRNHGKSLTAAYQQVTDPQFYSHDVAEERRALIEEATVNAFSRFSVIRRDIEHFKTEGGSDDDLVNQAVSKYRQTTCINDFPDEEQDPQIVAIVKAVWEDSQKETPDPNLSVHEFQKMVGPLLKQLREKHTPPAL